MKEEIRDIYDGELISAWEDGNFVFVCFPWCTINFPLEDFDDIANELYELVQVWKEEFEENANREIGRASCRERV